MKDVYGKLVRDKIPEIIVANGDVPVMRVLDDDEYARALNAKLQEEVAEYLDGFCAEELADILEVIRAIIEQMGMLYEEVERIRKKKCDERGGFHKKISLVEVERASK